MGLLTPESCIRHHDLFACLQPRDNFGLSAIRCTNANLALGLLIAREYLDSESPLLLLDCFAGHKDAIGKGSANHQARLNTREHTSINAAQRCYKWERCAIAFWCTNNDELVNHCLATKLGARWKPNSGNIALLQAAQDAGLLSGDIGANAAQAYRALRQVQHSTRLNEEATHWDWEASSEARAAALDLWAAVFGSPAG